MITWKTQLSWPRLDWSGDAALERFVRTRVRPTGLRVRAIDLSAFWDVPCVLGVARSRVPGDAPLGVGAAAAPTIERAIQKALDEAVRVRSWAHALHSARVPLPADIRDFDDHVRFYAEPAHAGRTAFLDASRDWRHVREIAPLAPADRVGQLCARLERRSASAYAVDVTAPDVRDAGLAVARVVAPELCALDVEHAAPLLGGRRLYEEPVRLGFGPRPINPDPHPFP